MTSPTRLAAARLPLVLLAALLLWLVPAHDLRAAGSEDTADEVEQLLRRGRRALEGGGNVEAITVLKKADKLAKGACLECLLGLASAHNASGEHDDALKLTRRLIEQAPPQELLAAAYNQQALALMAGKKKAPEEYKEAEDALRRAIELTPRPDPALRYNQARLMLRMGQREQGLAILREMAGSRLDPKLAAYVRLTLKDPECVEENCAPEFSLTTLDGEYFSRETLKGKVVLFDFCTTTFPPCLKNLPELKRLAKQTDKDPFVIVSAFYDADAPVLKEFTQKNGLRFPMCYDRGGQLTGAFFVKTFPTQVVVDHEGRIVWRSQALNDSQRQDVSMAISGAIKKAKKALAAAAPAQP